MSMQSPRDLREWQKIIERGVKTANRGIPIAIAHANDKAAEVHDEVETYKDLTPAAPIEVTFQTLIYTDPNKRQRGTATFDFPDVVFATNGTPISVDRYEIFGQDQGVNPLQPFRLMNTSTASSITVTDLKPGSVWKFRIRALSASIIKPGLFSPDYSVTVTADTTPPPQTSAPVATAISGGVKVTWDGLAAGGGVMPGDFDYTEVAFGMAASPTAVIDRFYGASFTIVPKTSYNTTHYFRLRAVDTSGNPGPWSVQATAIPVPLVDVDVILAHLDGAVTEITNIGAEAIKTGAITNAKLALNAVAQNNLQDQIVSLGKLDTATNAKIQKGVDDAFTAQAAANAADGKAGTAISNAAAADTKAGNAQTAADAARAVADAKLAAGVALTLNGNFDATPITSPPLGWPFRVLSVVQPSATTARSGTNVLKCSPTTSTIAYAYTDYVASATGRTFYIEYWARLDQPLVAGNENLELGAYFNQLDTSGASTSSPRTNNGPDWPSVKFSALSTTAWTKFAVIHTVTQANNVQIRFGPRIQNLAVAGNTFEVDGFRAIDITEAKAALDAAATAQARADAAFDDAYDANVAAGQAQTSANGKNNVLYLASLPSGNGFADGDTVFIRSAPGAPITAQWRWDKPSLTWKIETLGHQVIASVDLGKATIGELDGIYVKAFSLRADTLKIGSGANMFPDPKMLDVAGWPVVAGVSFEGVGTGKNGQGSMLVAQSATQTGAYYGFSDPERRTLVRANSSYRISVWLRANVTIPVGGVALYARQYPLDGSTYSFTTPASISNNTTIPANTWTELTGVVATGAFDSGMSIAPIKQALFTTSAVRFSDPTIEMMGIGRLIVDGTIQGNHILAGTIATKHLTVTDLTNFAPSLADSPTDWSLTNQMQIVPSSIDPTGYRFSTVNATADSRAYGPWMSVTPGESLWMGANLYRGSGTVPAYLRYEFGDANKIGLAGGAGTNYVNVPQSNTSATGVRFEGPAVVPAGAAYARWYIIIAAGTGDTGFYNIVGRRRLAGELLIDGTVTSDKVATNGITAKNILVGDFQNFAIGSDFEDPAAVPWTLHATHTLTTSQKKSGTTSLRLAAGTGSRESVFIGDMRVKEGEQYNFKYWAYIDASFNGTAGNSKLRIADQTGSAFIVSNSFSANTRSTWVPMEVTYTVSAGTTSLKVSLVSDNTAGTAYIDDVQIRRVSEASLIMNLGVEKLTASAASMGQAVIDKLWTDVVRSRRMTTDMMVVGRGVNGIVDEFFEQDDLKTYRDVLCGDWGAFSWSASAGVNMYGGTLTAGTSRSFYYDTVATYDKNSYIPVEPGQVWLFKAQYTSATSGPRATLRQIKRDGTNAYTSVGWTKRDLTSNGYEPAGTVRTLERIYTVPADVAYIMPAIQFEATCTSAYVYGGATLTNMATSSLVVDGAIAARNLTVTEEMWTNILHFKKLGGDEIDVNLLGADTAWIGILRGHVLINDAVTTGILKADAITSKHTITGATIQTTATALRGIKITSTGMKGWDSGGAPTLDIGNGTTNLLVGNVMTSKDGTGGIRLINSSEWGLPAIIYSYNGNQTVQEAASFMRYSIGGDPELVHRAPNRAIVGGTGLGFVRIEGDLVLSLGNGASGAQQMRVEQPFNLDAWSPQTGYQAMTLNGKLTTINAVAGNVKIDAGAYYVQLPSTYARTSGSAGNVVIASDGGLFRSTSASKYKILPEVMDLPAGLLDVQVKNWIDLAAATEFADFYEREDALDETEQNRFNAISLKRIPGAIAEDVEAAGGGDFVVYGEGGQIEGLMYDRLALAQIQLLKARIEELEARLPA